MSNFFQNLFDPNKKGGDNNKNNNNKSSGGGSGQGPKNPFANIKFGQQAKFQGSGQSLGGSVPGKLIPVKLEQEGTLGLKVEKRPNGQGTAIVSMVVEGSQAEAAGLQRGDILCFAGSEGKSEILYDDFLQMARSNQRPIVFDVRRISASNNTSKKNDSSNSSSSQTAANDKTTSADAYARKQAVIAAAEARDKANKQKWNKPVGRGEKKLSQDEKRKKELERERDAQLREQEAPRSEEAKRAMEVAKQSEAQWASQLGYNPYETNKVTAGQARNATVTNQHGTVNNNNANDNNKQQQQAQSIPNVQPPSDPTNEVDDNEDAMLLSQSPEFEEAYTTCVTTNKHEDVVSSFGIMRKLVVNATTKGQNTDDAEAAAKFRRVRLTNPKIRAAIVDVQGGLDLMMAFGFQLVEEDGESWLTYPLGFAGPNFLAAALRQMERYEKS